MHTACVWSVKLPFAEYSVVKDHERNVDLAIGSSGYLVVGSSRSNDQKTRRSITKFAVNLVENTGLEPVTSWLQTRRSPS
jgi:hypothetical protein